MFLLLYMYPRNHGFVANELMEYWILLGLLGEVERLDKKLAAAEKILEELNDVFFETVKMHRLIWDLAFHINQECAQFFPKVGNELRKSLHKDWCQLNAPLTIRRLQLSNIMDVSFCAMLKSL